MLWTRLTLLGAFMGLTYAGYGALILKGLDTINNWEAFHLAAVGASVFGLLFSVLWITTAKGSKAWFERYEAMLVYFQKTYKDLGMFAQVDGEELVLSYLDYKKRCVLKCVQPVDSNLFSQRAGSFSVSKIPIVMGQMSMLAWLMIGIVHGLVLTTDRLVVGEILKSCSCRIAGVMIAGAIVAVVMILMRAESSALKIKN